jgi:hypothetical protein
MRSILADFYAACPAELTTSANSDVIEIYDAMFMLTPYRNAVCAKSESGSFCAIDSSAVSTGTASSSAASASEAPSTAKLANGASLASVQQYLSTTDGSSMSLNATTFTKSNAPFLFLQSTLASAQLCTPCTRTIMGAYIDFETLCAYAPGITNSKLISGQTALYNAVSSTCGASFLQGAVQAAGSLNSGLTGSKSGAERSVAQFGLAATVIAALVMAVAAL